MTTSISIIISPFQKYFYIKEKTSCNKSPQRSLEKILKVLKNGIPFKSRLSIAKYTSLTTEMMREELLNIAYSIFEKNIKIKDINKLHKTYHKIYCQLTPAHPVPLILEIVTKIFQYLDIIDLNRASQVDHYFYRVANRVKISYAETEYNFQISSWSNVNIELKTRFTLLSLLVEDDRKGLISPRLNLPTAFIKRKNHQVNLQLTFTNIKIQKKIESCNFNRNITDTLEIRLNQALINQSEKSNLEHTKALLMLGANVNFQSEGVTPLTAAISSQYLSSTFFKNKVPENVFKSMKRETVTFLIQNSANVLYQNDKNATTPLMSAINVKDPSLVELLLKSGADQDIDHKNSEGDSALHLAAQFGLLDIVNMLLVYGANIHLTNNYNFNILEKAASHNAKEVVSFLELRGLKFQGPNDYRDTSPLIAATLNNNLDAVRLLLKSSAIETIDFLGLNNNTALNCAALNGFAEVVKVLLDAGANPLLQNNSGNTPLHRASSEGHTIIIEILLDRRADITAVNNIQQTPLHFAAQSWNYSSCKKLLEKGGREIINIPDANGNTPLHLALMLGHRKGKKMDVCYEIFDLFNSYDVDLNITNRAPNPQSCDDLYKMYHRHNHILQKTGYL